MRWLSLAVIAAACVALLAGLLTTQFGAWLQTRSVGARWSNAYTTLDTAEAHRPPERLAIANAMSDGPPPAGMTLGSRLHPPGTLAHLRYETFGYDGAPLDAWDVRALVPEIGNGIGPFWREPCSRSCGDELARAAGFRLHRSGMPGIAEEWVLRMPVGRPFDIERRPLTTQDILDPRERSMPIRYVKTGEQSLPSPARIRVTLVEACRGTPRVGTLTELAWSFSHLPIPSGFQTSRWAQLDGCGKLEPLPPPVQAQVALAADKPKPRTAPADPDLRAVVPRRERTTGHANLAVNEVWLHGHGAAVIVSVQRVCRYDPKENQWRALSAPEPGKRWRLAPKSTAGERVMYELPRETALFWVQWSERDDDRLGARVRYRDTRLVSGPVLCNDVMLGPAPEGSVATCVPFADHAQARFVPDPASACKE
ncbi:MAG: hypothetical protein IT518_24715 [Burkholderiales bacterium]|nr:hypothetical protein [Burkholderiales bacterium]